MVTLIGFLLILIAAGKVTVGTLVMALVFSAMIEFSGDADNGQ